MSFWVWLALGLGSFLSLLLASYLRLETVLAEQQRELRLRYLGSTFVIDIQKRELSWWLFTWCVLRRPFWAAKPKPKEASKKVQPRQSVSLQRLHQERDHLTDVWRALRRTVQVERFVLDARLATPNPVWTGTLYALASSFIYPLKAVWPHARLRLQADFVHELPSGTLDFAVRAQTLSLAVLGIKAFRLSRKLRPHRNRKEEHGSPSSTQGNRRRHAASR